MKRILSLILAVILIFGMASASFGVSSVDVKSISLSDTSTKLDVGSTYTMKVIFTPANTTKKNLIFSTSNKNVVAVDAKGNITGVSAGNADITVTSASNNKAVAKLKVTVVSLYGGTLKVLMGSDPACLGYPGKLQTFMDYIMAQPAVESLGRFDGSGVLKPHLAESFSPDYSTKTATVRIRKGINFQDGTPLNADAVIWNWKEYTVSGRAELNAVDRYEKINDYTVKVYLKTWDNTIVDNLAYYGGFMVSPTAYQKNGKDWAILNPVGTGPFKLKKWDRGIKIVYEKNKDYWRDGEPYLDGVEFNIVKDSTTAAAAMQSKQADVYVAVTEATLVEQLKKAGIEKISRVTGMGSLISGFMANSSDPKSPFYKLEVRQAMAYAVDGETINKVMTNGTGTYTNQWAPPSAWSYNKNVKGYPYNVAKAKELLTAAGYPNGFTTKIYTDNGASSVKRCTLLQQYLKAVGIKAEIVPMEQAKFDELNGKNGNYDGIALWASRGDPDTSFTYPRVLSKGGFRFVNATPHPQDLEALMAQAKAAPNMIEKKKLCQEMSQMVIDKYAYILPLYITSDAIMAQPYIKDSDFGYNYWSAWSPEKAKIVK